MSMTTRGAASSRYQRGGTLFQENLSRGSRLGSTATSDGKETGTGGKEERYENLPLSSLIVELTASDIKPTDGPARISNFDCIASYNWLNSSEPTILVPGSPAIWSPPAHRRKLEPDSGEVFIDQNAARYGAFPMEPMLRALFVMHPGRNVDDINVIICRNSMVKLFDFIKGNSNPFEMDIEMVGDKAVFLRRELNVTEVSNEFRGFGHTFPDEFTRWDSDVRGSSSHHQIVKYELAGWRYLVRCESNAYLVEKAGSIGEASSLRTRGDSNLTTAIAELSSGDMMTINEKRTKTGQDLVIRNRGREIRQEALVEIKTRAAHRVLDMERVLPRLWISQTPNLVAGYHKGGRFEDVQVFDVRKDVDEWETRNSVNLRKLNALLRQIVDTVQNTIAMKCRVRRASNGRLQIWELDIDHPSVLPDDLCLKLREDQDGQQT